MMSGHRVFRYLVLTVSVIGGLACGDFTSATSPQVDSKTAESAVGPSYSRWILISGVVVCVEGCDTTN